MHFIDITIFFLYMVGMLGIGVFFLNKNKGADDYYVGGRSMSSSHIGLSVVATDVGGGFSIGLGGLGFIMGISGSWMLFTGLIGAWLSAVFLIPVIKDNKAFARFLTFPQIFDYLYNGKVAFLAGVISAIGYLGFTSSQILAGAKLATGTFAIIDLQTALIIMGAIAVIYTVMGGIKAVIYTDTVQWIILMIGLIFIGIPTSYRAIGGWEAITATVKPEMLTLTNLTWQDLVNWGITIIPIWFVGMTLYQRIYACKDKKTAQRAWFVAGLFEWPVMAFMGVLLGLFARVAADQGMFDYLGAENISATDPETGLPMLLRTILPVGLMGLMMSAYFSAILSTADSCLMAASGNVVSDIIENGLGIKLNPKKFLRFSQLITLIIGTVALIIASQMTNVLNLMLYSYAFMVSGLFIPVVGGIYWKKSSPTGAFSAMLLGGVTTVVLTVIKIPLPFNLDANFFGITISLIVFIVFSLIFPKNKESENQLNQTKSYNKYGISSININR
ncbi:MAG: sodium:solute symporter family protein [Candidatus Cyclobacteriaceae bacterium M3_2C_046]